nr:hypothetical protein [Mesorhizobium loti]
MASSARGGTLAKRRKGDISAALSLVLPERGSRRVISLKNHTIAGTYRQIMKIVPTLEALEAAVETISSKKKGGISAALRKL